jgi:hypothetical protein
MSQSRFKKRKLEAIENYTTKLLSLYKPYLSPDEKKLKLVELQKKYWNNHCSETHARATKAKISRLAEKFTIHNQILKAERIERLFDFF